MMGEGWGSQLGINEHPGKLNNCSFIIQVVCTAKGSMYVSTTKNLLEYVCKLKMLINMRDRWMNGLFKRGERV